MADAEPAKRSAHSDWGKKDRVFSYVGEAEGNSEGACLKALDAHAVKIATGRFYFGEEKFIARNILERYLEQYANEDRFIASHEIIEQSRKGSDFRIRARVGVWVDRLFKDLAGKRFLYVPQTSPYFYVFLNETIDGSELTVNSPVARQQITSILTDSGLKIFQGVLTQPQANVDITGAPENSYEACKNAQRHGIEVIVSGAINTRQVAREKLYYTDLTVYEAEITLRLVRVDDEEVLKTARVRRRVANKQGQQAISEAIDIVVKEATEQVLTHYATTWAKTVHSAARYRLMLVDVSEDEVQAFVSGLKALHDDTKVYPRNYFGRVAVLNFDYVGNKSLLDNYIRGVSHPQYRLTDHGDDRFELVAVRD